MGEIFEVYPILMPIYAGILGLLLGSFANVVIYRLPEGLSVVSPRSRCPGCKSAIAWFDNIPVFSWVTLGGKCRSCKTKIHWRYPLVEIIMGALFAAIAYKFGFQFVTIEYLVFAFGLVTASFIDFDHMILPDVFTLGGVVIGLLGGVLNPERNFLDSFLGVLAGGGFLWLVAYVYLVLRKQEGMGGGDIKLLAWIGAILGWKAIPFVILSSSLLGTLVGLVVMLRTKGDLKTTIPFGPYLALGALFYLFGGQDIGAWYISLFLPELSP